MKRQTPQIRTLRCACAPEKDWREYDIDPADKDSGYVYVVRANGIPSATRPDECGTYKIGSSREMHRQLHTLISSTPYGVTLIAAVKTRQYRVAESAVHDYYEHARINGEWFDLFHHEIADALRFVRHQSWKWAA